MGTVWIFTFFLCWKGTPLKMAIDAKPACPCLTFVLFPGAWKEFYAEILFSKDDARFSIIIQREVTDVINIQTIRINQVYFRQ